MTRTSQKGFTLIEMLVIAPIVILAIGAFLTVIISMTGEVISSRASNILTYDIQDAMNRIEEDVKQSTNFLQKTSVKLESGDGKNGIQGYGDTTDNFLNVRKITVDGNEVTTQALILNTVVTNGNPLVAGTGAVYLKDKPNSCASSKVQNNTPMTMNIVYYIKEDPTTQVSSLWRRTIMPSDYANSVGCTTPWQQPSCTPDYPSTVAYSFCKTDDTKLVEGVAATGLFIQYFSNPGTTSPNVAGSNPDASDSERKTALYSSPTVSVSLSASQTVAGRTIERSASIRATRLETNATTISDNVVYSTPGKPKVTGAFLSPDNARFTWPAVSGGNVTYDAEYNIDGGAWQTALSGSSNLIYSRVALRGQTVNFRVRGVNTAGTSDWSTTASVKIPLWNPLILQNNWANYDPTYTDARYTKTSAGMVVLEAMIKRGGSASESEIIATLPEGYRPSTRIILPMMNSGASARVSIYPNGDIMSYGAFTSTWASFGTLTFIASDAGYTPSTLTLQNSWVNYSVDYEIPTAILDSAGRVNVQGMVKNGTAGVNMATFPAAWAPSSYTYPPVASASVFGTSVIGGSGAGDGIRNNVGSSTWVSLTSQFYSAAARGTSGADCTVKWCDLAPLQNSWVPYSTDRTPQYTKSADGLVTLRGLIKSGSTTANKVIASLPAGFRPDARIIFTNACNSALCRIDMAANGDLLTQSPALDTGWSSLDNIRFLADQ